MPSVSTTSALKGAPCLTFGEARIRILAGRCLLLLTLAGWSAAQLARPPGWDAWIVTGGFALAGLGGGLLAAWVNRFDLQFESDQLVRTRGVGPLASSNSRRLSNVSAVVLTSEERTTNWGEQQTVSDLSLVFDDGGRVRLTRFSGGSPDSVAQALSDRLERPLQTEERSELPRTPRILSQRLLSGAMWVSMVAVAAIMLAPVLSGSKPLLARPVHPYSASPQPSYQAGLDLFWSGRFADAESTLRRALREQPSNAEIANMLAYAQAEQHKMDDALKTAKQALALAPESGNILDTVGEMHERRGEYAQAAKYYREALKRLSAGAPGDSSETHTKLARTLVALHRPAEAIPHLDAALRYPNPQWVRAGQALLRQIAPNHPLPTPERSLSGRFPGPL
jgi:hypothetical protein